VLMATPTDLEDFALGFSLTEGLITEPSDITELAVVVTAHGIEVRMWLCAERAKAYTHRRRRIIGPTGCGLCGIESLAEAARPARRLAGGLVFSEWDIADAVAVLAEHQALNRETRAMHAAGFYRPGIGIAAIREDVGRHNALDKLGGALFRRRQDAGDGVVVITSRVSVEMVQKAAAIGAPILIAISAPTALAVRTAEAANMTLIALARDDDYQVFTGAWRIRPYLECR
jgi:FdhD protein